MSEPVYLLFFGRDRSGLFDRDGAGWVLIRSCRCLLTATRFAHSMMDQIAYRRREAPQKEGSPIREIIVPTWAADRDFQSPTHQLGDEVVAAWRLNPSSEFEDPLAVLIVESVIVDDVLDRLAEVASG